MGARQERGAGGGGGGLTSAIFAVSRNFSATAFCLSTLRAAWCPLPLPLPLPLEASGGLVTAPRFSRSFSQLDLTPPDHNPPPTRPAPSFHAFRSKAASLIRTTVPQIKRDLEVHEFSTSSWLVGINRLRKGELMAALGVFRSTLIELNAVMDVLLGSPVACVPWAQVCRRAFLDHRRRHSNHRPRSPPPPKRRPRGCLTRPLPRLCHTVSVFRVASRAVCLPAADVAPPEARTRGAIRTRPHSLFTCRRFELNGQDQWVVLSLSLSENPPKIYFCGPTQRWCVCVCVLVGGGGVRRRACRLPSSAFCVGVDIGPPHPKA